VIDIACRVQALLEQFYGLDRVANVADYISPGEREQLLVRDAPDGAVELRLELPSRDVFQIIEGVSHFVYVTSRASRDRTTTALEMEIHAEVDKWVVLAGSIESLDVDKSADLRSRLYERVAYLHVESTELGERYRIANRAALRFTRRLEREHISRRRFDEVRRDLHEMFHAGQEAKLRLAA
jgi:hypothetical protein